METLVGKVESHLDHVTSPNIFIVLLSTLRAAQPNLKSEKTTCHQDHKLLNILQNMRESSD